MNISNPQHQNKASDILMTALAMGVTMPTKKLKPKPTCIQCGCKLQPGRPGRKCKACREC